MNPFWPLGHNLNDLGRGWFYIPNMKALGLVVSDKQIFENYIFENLFFDHMTTYANNLNRWKKFVGDHPGTIPVEFGQIPISSSGEEVVRSFPYIIQCKMWPPGQRQFWPLGA